MVLSLHPRRLFRFSIGMMLFAMFCVCGYFAGYRGGFDAGLQGGGYHARLYVKEYRVGDLIVSRASIGQGRRDYLSLVDLLHTTVAPESWTTNGAGRGTIQLIPSETIFTRDASVLITQTQEVHDKIASLLGRLRKLQANAAVK
jgi:hypothetical protein